MDNKKRTNDEKYDYDVTVIGGGASGTALLYAMAAYTDIPRIALLEKYHAPGQVNSKATNNSQTLHVGDIETNYNLDKVRHVAPAAMMIKHYTDSLPSAERKDIIFPTQKMVLGVGDRDVAMLRKRYDDLKPLFPELALLGAAGIQKVEPWVMHKRSPHQPVAALYNSKGYAVNFERLATSLVKHAAASRPSAVSVQFDAPVKQIKNSVDGGYEIIYADGKRLTSRAVVVDADSYSLLFAKRLGYGKTYSLIPIAGTFYFSRELLRGKVYTVQDPKLPFAAVHGDPDVVTSGKTRWGPTARFHPVLESRNLKTSADYLASSGAHRPATWWSFVAILLDPTRLLYLLENMLYELPRVGDAMFLKHVRKIVPSIKRRDITKARGFGGMRLQRVNTTNRTLELGEGKIIGDNIIFNMTPSPGASVCLYNAMRDIEQLSQFFGGSFHFDRERMRTELMPPAHMEQSPSLTDTYVS